MNAVDENQSTRIRSDVSTRSVSASEHLDPINFRYGQRCKDTGVYRERAVHVDAWRSILIHATTPAEQYAGTTSPLIRDRCPGDPIPNTVKQVARELRAAQYDRGIPGIIAFAASRNASATQQQ